MKQKGFTLIELLVVVAIIGILAAVGVVAYSGYTSGARMNAVKARQNMIIKYIKTETAKCMWEATAIDKFKNIVNQSSPSMCTSPSGTCSAYNYQSKGSAGVTNLRDHGPTTMEVGTCVNEPCTYKDKDYIESDYIVIFTN